MEREDDCGRAQAATARVLACGQSWPPVPGVFDGQRMSRGAYTTRPRHFADAAGAPGLPHVGQFTVGAA